MLTAWKLASFRESSVCHVDSPNLEQLQVSPACHVDSLYACSLPSVSPVYQMVPPFMQDNQNNGSILFMQDSQMVPSCCAGHSDSSLSLCRTIRWFRSWPEAGLPPTGTLSKLPCSLPVWGPRLTVSPMLCECHRWYTLWQTCLSRGLPVYW